MNGSIDDVRWSAIVQRTHDDSFRFGVRSTRIYCRAGCPARTPLRANVMPFESSDAARDAGFRACKRCAPDDDATDAAATRIIERAARLLAGDERPTLAEVAAAVGLSRFHFHRLFRSIVGVTPGEYVRARRAERLRASLRDGASVTAAIQDAGYGSPSRVYGEPVLGMTPGRLRAGGRGETLTFAVTACALGRVLAAASERGVCAIELGDDDADVVRALERHFPHATFRRDDAAMRETLAAVVGLIDDPAAPVTLALDVRGTAFQRRVWNALCDVAPGEPVTYAALARAIGSPRAAQAVGAACGANALAVAIPCHRAVREDGAPSGYRWGVERKRALLRREAGARR